MKKTVFILFVLICLIQVVVPSKMILDTEDLLNAGSLYRFRTAPVDPYDPFRGRYITLEYEASVFKSQNDSSWQRGDEVYVSLGTDTAGYAIISNVSRQAPEAKRDYVIARIRYAYGKNLSVEYPFNKLYMEESKAEDAERTYRENNLRNAEQETYALVKVKEGEAVLKDMMVGGTSIKVLVEKMDGVRLGR